MKKGLLGCLLLFVIVLAGAGYAAYRFVYLPGKAYVESFAQLKVVPELNAQVKNQAAFVAPASQELTSADLDRFLGVQRAIRGRLGSRLTELQAKYKTFDSRNQEGGKKPSMAEAFGAFRDLAGLYVEAKRAQVDALNAEGLSLANYEWMRARAYEAAGMPVDLSIQHALNEIAAGKKPGDTEVEQTTAVVVPEKNRKLVAPHAEELSQGMALVFFAL